MSPASWVPSFTAVTCLCPPLAIWMVWKNPRLNIRQKVLLGIAPALLTLSLYRQIVTFYSGHPSNIAIDIQEKARLREAEDKSIREAIGYSRDAHTIEILKSHLSAARDVRWRDIIWQLNKLEPENHVWEEALLAYDLQQELKTRATKYFGPFVQIDSVRIEGTIRPDGQPSYYSYPKGSWILYFSFSRPRCGRLELTKRLLNTISALRDSAKFNAIGTLSFRLINRGDIHAAQIQTFMKGDIPLSVVSQQGWKNGTSADRASLLVSNGMLTFANQFPD